MRFERGVALVQVLIISLILTTLAVFVSQTVSQQVKIGEKVKKAFELQLKLERGEARLLQKLLSNQFVRQPNSLDAFVKNWNFHGEPFNVGSDVTYEIQDLSSLISLNKLYVPTARQVLRELNVGEQHLNTFVSSVIDWVDKDNNAQTNGAEYTFYKTQGRNGPRNGYLQSFDEITFIQGAEHLSLNSLEKYFSIELTAGFNPLNAPDIVLSAFVNNESVAKQLIELREEGKLNRYQFYLLTGRDDDEFLTFSPGRKLRIKISVTNKEQMISKQFIASFTPRNYRQPVTITSVKWN
ncbi:general secretion pathway protein GspK [Pseudoalteromonas sp.]|uniref:general secretion pathway protein GspK n=1 Tax=Pseudoalteromonas sp. TaxID=53249 RepID=UPI00356B240F